MSKAKTKPVEESHDVTQVLLGHGLVTIPQREGDKVVRKTFELIAYADMPRQVRRQLRNALFKAAPSPDSTSDKADMYLSSYEAGLIALRAAGATIDPNDEELPVEDADVLDQAIMIVGLRTLGEMRTVPENGPKAGKALEEASPPSKD